ncbi:MAG: hypothetical protein NVS4B11_22540 [Ktedonobacteraceae bacterium]
MDNFRNITSYITPSIIAKKESVQQDDQQALFIILLLLSLSLVYAQKHLSIRYTCSFCID